MAGIPWSLKGYAGARLGKLDVEQLREMCTERGLDVCAEDGIEKCVSQLLIWKERPAEASSPKSGDAAPPDAPKTPVKHGVNINVIALHNSRRLAQTLQPALADAVINERRLNGDFRDFDDLQQRVHGLRGLHRRLRPSG